MNTTGTENTGDSKKFYTSRFGELEIQDSEILSFPEGMLGFHDLRRYVIIKDPEQDPFLWLQALDAPDVAFVIVDPFLFFPGYEIQVKSHELATIQITNVSESTVLTIVTIPQNPQDITTNLRGPLVLNMQKNLGKQLVLIDDRYHTRHFMLHDVPVELATPPGGAPVEPVRSTQPD